MNMRISPRPEFDRQRISTGLRFDRPFYALIQAIFIGVAVSGVAWLLAAYVFDVASDGLARPLSQVHGAFAFASLSVIGAILFQHARLGWRARRNRVTGLMATATALILSLTAYGLYYGSEEWHSFMVWLHIALGLAAVAIVPLHLWIGRRTR